VQENNFSVLFLLSELNRFTINSVNHPHSDVGRQAPRDDNNEAWHHWLRSPGNGFEWDTWFRTVVLVWTSGFRYALNAHFITVGFRPSL